MKQMLLFMDGKPVGMATPAMLTYCDDDDSATKERSGEWRNPYRQSYEITGHALIRKGSDISELLGAVSNKVDVEISRKPKRLPRKMKKALRVGSRYRRDTKWKRLAKIYERRYIYRLPNAEIVITREQMGTLEATIRGSDVTVKPDAVARVSGKDINKAIAAYLKRR